MKTKQRGVGGIWVLVMAAFFLVQGILGAFFPKEAQAQAASIERWDEEALLDYGHRFTMKYQAGITEAQPYGCDDQDVEAFTNYGRSGRKVSTKRMTEPYEAGSAGIRYYNVGQDENGNIVDVQLSVLQVTNAQPRYDMLSVDKKYKEWKDGIADDGLGYAWENGIGQPIVAFSLDSVGLYIYNVGSAKVQFQFYKHQTDEPLTISGHGTLQDIDAGQGISLGENNGLDNAYVLEGNDFLEVDGTNVQAGDESLEILDKRGWLNLLYQTDQITFSFVHQGRLDRWDRTRQEQIEKYGSVEKWAEYMRKHYTDQEGNSLCPNFDGGKYMRGHAYFDFTSYSFSGIEMKKEPEKRVGAVGSSWEEAQEATRENPYEIIEDQEFQYLIQAEVTPNQLRSFVLKDTLEACLSMEDTSKIKVWDDAGNEATGKFQLSLNGQDIICSAKESALQEESFTNNRHYTFVFSVHKRTDADMTAYTEEDGYTFLVPNQAVMSYERVNGTGGTLATEVVWVKGIQTAQLAVSKQVEKYEWREGETIPYTVSVTQTKEHSQAVNVLVEDLNIPAGLSLMQGQYQVETVPENLEYSLNDSGENGWQLLCPRLPYGGEIRIHYQCLALSEGNGQEWVNTVEAAAENAVDPETKEPKVEKDMAEIWINTPELQIEKSADRYEWKEGEEVRYRVNVTNVKAGTIGRDVRIADIGLPDGLVLSEGVQSVEILDLMSQVEYPIPDHKTGQATEIVENPYVLNADGNGFDFSCAYLPYSHPITILFHCTALENANGHESVNVASVSAANADEQMDDAETYVNTGALWIEKTADHYEWQLGEEVEYEVTVENQAEGTIARNVSVWDVELPLGLSLTSAEAVEVTGIPETVTELTAGTADPANELNPQWYGEMVTKEVTYELMPEGNGWRLNLSALPCGNPVTIRFKCTVTEEANGMERVNEASALADNADIQIDDAEVYINTAALSLEKTVFNPYLNNGDGRTEREFRVGEKVYYQVVVDNVQKGSIARNLVVQDISLPEGLLLDTTEEPPTVSGIPEVIGDPVAGTVDESNQLDEDNYNEIAEKEVSYQLNTDNNGWRLTISDLPYHTPVTVTFCCTVQESVNGWEIINNADAYAQNALLVKDHAKIWVNTPVLQVEKTADKKYCQQGELLTYRVNFTQQAAGCVARNVSLQDVMEDKGMKILKDSIVLLDQNGNEIDGEIQMNGDCSFTVNTYRNLCANQGYILYDSTAGGAVPQVTNHPLEDEAQQLMSVEYQAAVVEEAYADQNVINTVMVQSDEQVSDEDTEEISLLSPVLEIKKESDKQEYAVGENGYYHLSITQKNENVKANDITVEDMLGTEGAKLEQDSILVKKNGQLLIPESIGALDRGFQLEIHTSLGSEDRLEVFYKVFFEEASLAGNQVVNVARARSEDALEVTEEHTVIIKPELILTSTPTPSPTPACCPKNTMIPTKTPGQPTKVPDITASVENNPEGLQASSAKTGESRPFSKMTRVGIGGLLLLLCGIWYYKKTKKNEKHKR